LHGVTRTLHMATRDRSLRTMPGGDPHPSASPNRSGGVSGSAARESVERHHVRMVGAHARTVLAIKKPHCLPGA
jgi:hypothetical protein